MEYLFEHSFVLVIFLAGAVLFLSLFLKRRRREALAQLAAASGLQFSEEGPGGAELERTGLELFRLGRSRSAENLIRLPSRAGEVSFFDYSYTTGSGKNRSTHSCTAALVPAGSLTVPQFDLKPENFLHKIGEAVGFRDIDIPGHEVFSDNYRLTGPAEAAVLNFFSPRRVVWLESHQGLRIQGAAGWLLLFRKEGQLSAEEWGLFMEEVKAFVNETL